MDNNFSVDTSRRVKKDFVKKISTPLGIALWLMAFELIGITVVLVSEGWRENGLFEFSVRCLHWLTMFCILVCLIKLMFDAKPFSHSFTLCTRLIAVLYLLASVIFPRLPGFSTNFGIFQNGAGTFTLIDARYLIRGLLLWVFSVILQEGFLLQKDMEETI